MESTVKQRLVSFITYKNLTQRGFSTSIGVSEGYVGAMKNSMQPEVLNNISIQYPELNLEWLLVGRGEMIRGAVLVEGGNGNVAKDEFYEARLDKLLNIIESQQHTIKTLVCRLGELENP